MMAMQAIYRVRQGLNNLSATARPEDAALAARYLTQTEQRFFARMEVADQKHCVGVLKYLLRRGMEDRQLLKAALLHDVGKSRSRISVFHRTAAVLLRAIFGEVPSFLTWIGGERLWGPFYVLENHPRLGAVMLAKAGCDERVWRLAELHHVDPKLLNLTDDAEWMQAALWALRKADSES